MDDFEEYVRGKYRRITNALIEKKKYITTMESCTSGLIASLITDTEGSSAIMKGAFVTYSNEAKIRQGVPEAVIAEHGVYSCETAAAMAGAAMEAYSADIAIGVTGTMGNVDPANSDSTPGEVYYAIAYGSDIFVTADKLMSKGTRAEYKLVVANLIADKLLEILAKI